MCVLHCYLCLLGKSDVFAALQHVLHWGMCCAVTRVWRVREVAGSVCQADVLHEVTNCCPIRIAFELQK